MGGFLGFFSISTAGMIGEPACHPEQMLVILSEAKDLLLFAARILR